MVESDSEGASVLLSNGSHAGTFVSTNLNFGGSGSPAFVALCDFDNDGFLDIALADGVESYYALLNSPAHPAQFTSHYYYLRYTGPIAASDFNGDGAVDLLVADSEFQSPVQRLSFIPGLPASPGQFLDYNFTSPPPGLRFSGKSVVNGFAITDVNGDGLPDMVEATNTGVAVLISDTPAYTSLIGGTASYPGDSTYAPSSLHPAVGSSFTVSRTVIPFGSRPIGLTGTSTVAFTNTTSAPIQVLAFPTQIKNIGDFGVGSGNSTIAAGATSTYSFVFRPLSEGLELGDITFLSSAGDVQEISMSGPGTPALPAGPLSFNPGVVEFGSQKVGTSGTSKITVSNNSSSGITITSLTFTGHYPGDFAVTKNTCPNTIPSTLNTLKTCSIYVTLKPTAVGGRSANLTVNISGGTYQLVPLTGPAN